MYIIIRERNCVNEGKERGRDISIKGNVAKFNGRTKIEIVANLWDKECMFQ